MTPTHATVTGVFDTLSFVNTIRQLAAAVGSGGFDIIRQAITAFQAKDWATLVTVLLKLVNLYLSKSPAVTAAAPAALPADIEASLAGL